VQHTHLPIHSKNQVALVEKLSRKGWIELYKIDTGTSGRQKSAYTDDFVRKSIIFNRLFKILSNLGCRPIPQALS